MGIDTTWPGSSALVCMRFKSQLESMRNYNPAFIDGSTNVKTSSFKDHASTGMIRKPWTYRKRVSLTIVFRL